MQPSVIDPRRLAEFELLAFDAVGAAVAGDGTSVARFPERTAARGYYPSLCFKLSVTVDGEDVEVGDGGLVDWTQALLGNRKERVMTSGLSLERLALVEPHPKVPN